MLPQSPEPQKPTVWKWYVAYCIAMALLYLLVVVAGFAVLFIEPARSDMEPLEAKIISVTFIGMGLALMLPYVAGPLLPRRRWAWVVGIVLISIGLTSLCCLPAAIPLLIWWLKPETKEYYNEGRGA